MERTILDILGLCEVRWKGTGDFVSGKCCIIYSGGNERQQGVGIVLGPRTRNSVLADYSD